MEAGNMGRQLKEELMIDFDGESREREDELEMLKTRVKGALKRTEDVIMNLELENPVTTDEESTKTTNEIVEDEDLEILEMKLKLAKIKLADEINAYDLEEKYEKACDQMKKKIHALQQEYEEKEKERKLADQELKETLETLEFHKKEREISLLRETMIQQQVLGSMARHSVIQRKILGGQGVREGLEEVREKKEEQKKRRKRHRKRT